MSAKPHAMVPRVEAPAAALPREPEEERRAAAVRVQVTAGAGP
jgi:hypothetical protein